MLCPVCIKTEEVAVGVCPGLLSPTPEACQAEPLNLSQVEGAFQLPVVMDLKEPVYKEGVSNPLSFPPPTGENVDIVADHVLAVYVAAISSQSNPLYCPMTAVVGV